MRQRGFALLAALWLIAGVSGLALAATLAAREATQAARNRMGIQRARWRAEGCLERIRSELNRAVTERVPWEDLAVRVPIARLSRLGCSATLRPAGYAIDVNAADRERLIRLLLAWGTRSPDSLAEALLDWRDADDVPRAMGAEVAWYMAHDRPGPRNGPLVSEREIRLVRGFDDPTLATVPLGVEPGRTPLNLAPLAVVVSLPGITVEIAEQLKYRREVGEPIRQLGELVQGVSSLARDSVRVRYGDLVSQAVIEPEAWILSVSADEGTPPLTATVEVRLAPAEARAAIVRKRVW